MLHRLKIQKEFADKIITGEKTFELRKDDRRFQELDMISFDCIDKDGNFIEHEINHKTYKITYKLNGWGLEDGYVALAITESDGSIIEEKLNSLKEIVDQIDEELKAEHKQLIEWLEELKEYKELKEQGLLLKLPYNMQTGVVYYIDEKDHDIYELRADKIEISKAMITNKFAYTIDWCEFYLEDFGKIVFTTKKEAEQALEKMKER